MKKTVRDENTYSNLLSTYSMYSQKNNYTRPENIWSIIFRELGGSCSKDVLMNYIENLRVGITEREIINYLQQKSYTLIEKKPKFEPYTLHYFKKYTEIVKRKCLSLFQMIDFIEKNQKILLQDEKMTGEMLASLDITLEPNGGIYYPDAIRLSLALIENINELSHVVECANNLDTYLYFSLSPDYCTQCGISENDLYPKENLQVPILEFDDIPGYIPFSPRQKVLIEILNKERFYLYYNYLMDPVGDWDKYDNTILIDEQTRELGDYRFHQGKIPNSFVDLVSDILLTESPALNFVYNTKRL